MATLTGVSIASSYTSLLKLDGNTDSTAAGNGSNAIQVKTGDNEATPLFLNTDRLGIGTANVQSPLHIFSTINNTFSDTISATDFTGDVLTIENKPASSNDDYVSIAMSTSGSQFVSSRIVLDNDGSGAGALNFQLRSPGDLSNTTTFMKIKSTGDVEIPSGSLGIGVTPNADTPLHIFTNSSSTQTIFFDNDATGRMDFVMRNDRSTEGSASHSIFFDGADNAGNNTRYATIENHIVDNADASEDGKLVFSTMVAGTDTETLNITGGNVGIGVSPIINSTIGSTSARFLDIDGGSFMSIITLARTTTGADNNLGSLQFVNKDNADSTNNDADGELVSYITATVATSDSNNGDDSGANLLFYTKPESGTIAERMRIKSGGDVSFTGWVEGNDNNALFSNSSTGLLLQAPTTTEKIFFRDFNGNAGMTYDASNQRLGIGITPTVPLTVNNQSDHSDVAIFHAGGGTPDRGLKISTYSATNANAGVDLDAQNATGQFTFSTGGTERMRLTSTGLGIGISDPDGKVHIHSGTAGAVTAQSSGDDLVIESSSNAGISILSPDAQKSRLYFGSTNNNNIGNIGGFYNSGAFQLFFNISGTDRFIIDGNSRISLSNNDASSGNTIFGYQAMNVSGASASHNVAIGNEAMHDVNTSQFNVAIGSLALTKEVNGDRSVAIGYQSLYSQSNSGTEITENVGVGVYAGFTNVTGTKNTYVGGNAGFGSASGSNSNNVGIGYNALLSVSTGSYNTALGSASMLNATTATNNVCVGNQSNPSANDSTNQIVIGQGATGQADNSVTLGNSSVTKVYMAQDKRATMLSGEIEVVQASDVNASVAFIRAENSSDFSSSVLNIQGDRTTTNGSYSLANFTNAGTSKCQITDGGDLKNTNNAYGAISDEKLKQDIADASSQWEDIKAVQFRKFKFKDMVEEGFKLGVVAQEIEKVSPKLVSEAIDRDADGKDLGTTTKSVKYSILQMKGLVALQEAMKRIEELEAKVEELEKK